MRTGEFDAVVVGGGVTGLTVALRLAGAGMRVAVIERDLLGAGATTHNHGVLHSGALYVRWHPEIVRDCADGRTAFVASFPDCLSGVETCWYIGTSATVDVYRPLWERHGIAARRVEQAQLGEVLADPDGVAGHAVAESVIDSHALICELAARAAAAGVELIVGADATEIVTADGRVRGVTTTTVALDAPRVVVCAGIGTRPLLQRSGSRVVTELTSRLETMMAFPGTLATAVIGLEFGWPFLAPSVTGRAVLASRYGAPQRFVRGEADWPVPAAEIAALIGDLGTRLCPGVLDLDAGVAWVGVKTEHPTGSDQWGTSPNYAVVDHRVRDGITGWWTVLPGKMTLALHASRAVATAITGTQGNLTLPAPGRSAPRSVESLVAVTPWTAHEEVDAA
ncbi:FAD-dependent oxidoreductase [Nocardia panacis]|uniref:FAD-dependent oxidoreductase n=1 Tax=Nocardia panacis TaxID=2340916 RepID=A0A3A4K2F3_9NOCA|nr:FAD-dependent oxidoreductase [Nocardia panacis]RJO70614.1 FAD-dependent oxidoreductase [Nocardia panacis]